MTVMQTQNKIRLKMECTGAQPAPGGGPGQKVNLTPQFDPSISEGQRASTATTPRGGVWLEVDNPAIEGLFQHGKQYWVEITPANG